MPLLFRKSGGKTVNDICIKKALDKSLVSKKVKIVAQGLVSMQEWHATLVHTAASVQESK
jgi:hypothetical protein